jgi:3-oxoacyl-[acyl-carrier-protein] synthase III
LKKSNPRRESPNDVWQRRGNAPPILPFKRRGACFKAASGPKTLTIFFSARNPPTIRFQQPPVFFSAAWASSRRAGAVDFSLGCAGYVYSLSLAKGLIESGQVRNVLLLTAETLSKYLEPRDRSARTIFGDGASASWIVGQTAAGGDLSALGPIIFGTDGAGAENLIVRKGATRNGARSTDTDSYLVMNGGEVFAFTLQAVPEAVRRLLERSRQSLTDVDWFVFHQANQYMLDHLRQKIGIPEAKFVIDMSDCGNTGSTSIPIAFKRAVVAGRIRPGHRVMLVGFGVGYSWGALMLRWA